MHLFYGPRPLQCVCAAAGDTVSCMCRRRGPIGAAPDDVLVAHIRRVLEAAPFHGEGYRKAWAKLRVAGISKERVRRLMREHDLQAPPRAGHAHGPKAHDGTITTEAPDVSLSLHHSLWLSTSALDSAPTLSPP